MLTYLIILSNSHPANVVLDAIMFACVSSVKVGSGVIGLDDRYCSVWTKLSNVFVGSLHVAAHNNRSWNYLLKLDPINTIQRLLSSDH